MISKPVNKPSARKSMCIFTNILDLKKKNTIHQFGADKFKRKATKYGTTTWALKRKKKLIQKSMTR